MRFSMPSRPYLELLRAMVHRLYFVSMEALWEFLAGDFDYEPPPK